MAISGGIKFFTKNKININSDISASTGNSSAYYIADENYFTNWRSVNSNDVTSETITISFSEATTIDRIHLIGHNWKNYTIKYNTSSNFSNVTSLDSTGGSSIAETSYSKSESYYEFSSVSVNSILITINTTQTANEEKYLRNLKITQEYGTLQGFPKIENFNLNKGFIVDEAISRRSIVDKQYDVFAFNLSFENYPVSSTYTADHNLMMSLYDLEYPFYVWLCGGRYGFSYFRHTLRGFRLQDVILMNITDNIQQSYKSNIYINPVNLNFELKEAVDDTV